MSRSGPWPWTILLFIRGQGVKTVIASQHMTAHSPSLAYF